jgi:ribosomal protein L28
MCEGCNRKKPLTGNSRSHSNVATKRTWKHNLQTIRVAGKQMIVCARCLKTMVKQRI